MYQSLRNANNHTSSYDTSLRLKKMDKFECLGCAVANLCASAERLIHLLTFANVKWARYSEKTDNATAQNGRFEEKAPIIIQSLFFGFIFMARFLNFMKIHVELIILLDFFLKN